MPSTNGHGERTGILYARASMDDQEYSNPGQLRELAAHDEIAGLRIAAQIEDRGEKRHTLDRPGIREIRELCATGEIDEVWAWAWDRYGEFPMPEVLALELEESGTELRSLDDGGGGEASYEMNVIRSLFSRREQKSRVDRSRRGRFDKALRGEVFGGFRARYGFRFVRGRNQRGREVSTGYEVDPQKMAHVRRIFELVADGYGLKGVRREFEQSGIPNPSGGPRWSTTTIRKVVLDDLYKPHTYDEAAAIVRPDVAAKLNPRRVYGIHWHGKTRSRFKDSKSKQRVTYETPPEEWIAVPVDLTDSGLDRATVEAARERIRDNRPSSKVGDRFWTLSGGILRCAECGRAMTAYRRAKQSGYNYYYRCRPSTSLDVCPNRKSHPAEDLETRAWNIFRAALDDHEEVTRRFKEMIADERRQERHVATLSEEIVRLEGMRSGYQDQQAEGLMTLDELRAKLENLGERINALRGELDAALDHAKRKSDLEQAYLDLLEMLERGEERDVSFSPEAQHRRYKELGVRLEVDRDGNLTESWSVAVENNVNTLCPPAAATSSARLA